MFKGVAAAAVLGVLALGALLAWLSLERRTELTLPTPTGPLAVGRAMYDWTDETTTDALAPIAGTKREVLAWIWYPAATGGERSLETGDYVPAHLRAARGSAQGVLGFLTHDLSKVHSHSIPTAGVSPHQQSYPLLIMRGGASAEVLNYTTLAEELASHGYVVVGIDAPYRTNLVVFPDGRIARRLPENNPELCVERKGEERARCLNRLLSAWTGDIAFALDRLTQLNASDASGRFTRRLDMTRVGVFGHSFGGSQAAQFCHDDTRCKAGIDVDGIPLGSVVREGIHRPFMFLLSDHRHESDAESGQVGADIQSIYDRLPPDGRAFVMIRGANHFLFSDDGALLKSPIVRRALRLFGMLGIDGRRQLEITAYCVRGFFDKYLEGRSDWRLEGSSSVYPEIQVLK